MLSKRKISDVRDTSGSVKGVKREENNAELSERAGIYTRCFTT
jgi:hypothetical protein